MIPTSVLSQVGISVSPPRVYFTLNQGESESQKILISNVSKENSLNLALTLGDWEYDSFGNNVMLPPDSLENSCANWLNIPSGTYLTLEPGEHREIDVTMSAPAEIGRDWNVHSAMLYVTQMNPVDGVDTQGAAIKVSVRQGIKIYRKGKVAENKQIEIENLAYDKDNNSLLLLFNNIGNIWLNGHVNAVVFNQATGKELTIESVDFYTMPGDIRSMRIPLQHVLDKGRYTVTVMLDYGDLSTVEAAELQFTHE